MRLANRSIAVMLVLLGSVACATQEQTTSGGSSTDEHAHDHGDDSSWGAPADPADADRTIRVEGTDELRFEPAEIEVSVGETIAFEFVNVGSLDHELVLAESAGGEEDHVHGTEAPNATGVLPPGESDVVAWTFEQPGEYVFECHVDNHDDAGMRGTIAVS